MKVEKLLVGAMILVAMAMVMVVLGGCIGPAERRVKLEGQLSEVFNQAYDVGYGDGKFKKPRYSFFAADAKMTRLNKLCQRVYNLGYDHGKQGKSKWNNFSGHLDIIKSDREFFKDIPGFEDMLE